MDTISPTLGFNIKTLEHPGCRLRPCACSAPEHELKKQLEQVRGLQAQYLGHRWTEDNTKLLEEAAVSLALVVPFSAELVPACWRNYFEATDGLVWASGLVRSAIQTRQSCCRVGPTLRSLTPRIASAWRTWPFFPVPSNLSHYKSYQILRRATPAQDCKQELAGHREIKGVASCKALFHLTSGPAPPGGALSRSPCTICALVWACMAQPVL